MRLITIPVVAICLGLLCATGVFGQRRIIELEIAASRFEPVETQQRWMQMLSGVGADRVRSKTSGTGIVKITETELSGTVRIKVQGAIDKGKLVLPGKSFSLRQKSDIADYIKGIRDDGANVALAEKKAFGLTSQQLVDINQALQAKINFETTGMKAGEFFSKAGRRTGMRLVMDETARTAVAGREEVLDELEGFSVGTSIAAVARTLGLVLVPKRTQGKPVQLHLVDYRSAEEFWPIGWPGNKLPRSSLPTMYKKYPIEIRNAPLDQALMAVKVRAKVPLIFDHNSMAIAEIDLTKSNVTYVKDSSNYINLLTKILNQTKPRMDFEIRIDENGKPFLWLSTANPVR